MSDINCYALSTAKGLNAAKDKSWNASNELQVSIFGTKYPESETSYKRRYKEGIMEICKKEFAKSKKGKKKVQKSKKIKKR